MRRTSIKAAAAILAGGLILAACSSDGDNNTVRPTRTASPTTSTSVSPTSPTDTTKTAGTVTPSADTGETSGSLDAPEVVEAFGDERARALVPTVDDFLGAVLNTPCVGGDAAVDSLSVWLDSGLHEEVVADPEILVLTNDGGGTLRKENCMTNFTTDWHTDAVAVGEGRVVVTVDAWATYWSVDGASQEFGQRYTLYTEPAPGGEDVLWQIVGTETEELDRPRPKD